MSRPGGGSRSGGAQGCGWPYPFCQAIYQMAGAVERFFAWLKGFRRLALG